MPAPPGAVVVQGSYPATIGGDELCRGTDVTAGEPNGFTGITGLDRTADAQMCPENVTAKPHLGILAFLDGRLRPVELLGVPDALQDARQDLQRAVPRRFDELLMEPDGQRRESDAVLDLPAVDLTELGELATDRDMIADRKSVV